jgi:CHAT domain-containing protein
MILSELMLKVVVLRDKIFLDLMVHEDLTLYECKDGRCMPSVKNRHWDLGVLWCEEHLFLQQSPFMASHKMSSLVPTLYERVQNLLQEAQIRVEESHPHMLLKEDSIEDLKQHERLLQDSCDALDEVLCEITDMLLKELYQALIAPVEAALEGAEELLIVPHKELFEVPWAALTHADGSYLIERYVIRTAPSLRVARQTADKMQQQMQQHGKPAPAHVVLVGNPLPTRLDSLPLAEEEVKDIEDILKRAGVDVHAEHYFRSDRNPPATKTNVKSSLEGADWAHMACHADLETDSLVLAIPCGSADQGTHVKMVVSIPCDLEKCTRDFFETFKEVVAVVAHVEPEVVSMTGSEIQRFHRSRRVFGLKTSTRIEVRVGVPPQHQEAEEIRKRLTEVAIKRELVSRTGPAAQQMSNISLVEAAAVVADLSMLEVQGSEGAQGVRLAEGATVVLSACNTGRGEIKAEGVVGLARGFLLANASAAVVSLWSVDDGSTAALMRIKYSHLVEGCTVAQALRLAMLRLARRPPQKLGQKQTRDRAAGAVSAAVSDDSESSEARQDGHCDELDESWKRPIHWAAFLVVGATTSLRHHSPNNPP